MLSFERMEALLPSELDEVIAKCRILQTELLAHVSARQVISVEYRQVCKAASERYLLLRMAEGLIDAHKAAKIDDNGMTIDLIEDAMRHVGERLARETGDGRNFSRRRLGPHR